VVTGQAQEDLEVHKVDRFVFERQISFLELVEVGKGFLDELRGRGVAGGAYKEVEAVAARTAVSRVVADTTPMSRYRLNIGIEA